MFVLGYSIHTTNYVLGVTLSIGVPWWFAEWFWLGVLGGVAREVDGPAGEGLGVAQVDPLPSDFNQF